MSKLVPPHVPDRSSRFLLPESERAEERKRAEMLKKIPLDSRAVSDVFMLAMGAYTPLDGFMGSRDWRGACVDMKLPTASSGRFPITLSVDKDLADSINPQEEVALTMPRPAKSSPSCEVREKYSIDKKLEAEHVYRTADPKHPGVAKVLAQGDVNLAGPGRGAQRRRISRQISRALYPPRPVTRHVP